MRPPVQQVWNPKELEWLTDISASIDDEDDPAFANDADLPMVKAALARDAEARYALQRNRRQHASRPDFAARLARDEFRGRNARRRPPR